MGVQTITIKTCDRCKARIHEVSKDHPESGECSLAWKGWYGGITAQGDYGGANMKGSALLCRTCSKDFGDWLRRFPAAIREGDK